MKHCNKALSEKECTEEYKRVLSTLNRVTLFQYTFIITVAYVAFAKRGEAHSFFGLELPFGIWMFLIWAVVGGSSTYVSRNVQYLDKLLFMHYGNRRKLRFLAYHHTWVLNPLRGNFLKGTGLLSPGRFAHMNFTFVLPIMLFMFAFSEPADEFITNTLAWLLTFPLVSFFFLSVHRSFGALERHGKRLWGFETPEEARLEKAGKIRDV